MALGAPTYGTSLLAHLGIGNVFGDDGPYPSSSCTTQRLATPMRCSRQASRTHSPRASSQELESVAPTIFVDGKDLFWWGARTPAALARLGHSLRVLD